MDQRAVGWSVGRDVDHPFSHLVVVKFRHALLQKSLIYLNPVFDNLPVYSLCPPKTLLFEGFRLIANRNLVRSWLIKNCLTPLTRCGQVWKATKEYLNQRGTKIRVFRERFRAPLLPPFSLIFPPSFPFRPCSLSHHFSPLPLPLYPRFFDSLKTPI